jgi:hypothetical protein
VKRFTCPGWEPREPCGVEFDVVAGQVVECLDVGWHRVTDEDMVEMKGDELLCGGCKWARLAEVEYLEWRG